MNRCYLHRLSSRIVRMAEGGDQPSSFIVVDVEGDLKDFEKEDSVYEFTKSYLENTGRSGGGKFVSGGFVKNPESQKLQYVVHYANAKSTRPNNYDRATSVALLCPLEYEHSDQKRKCGITRLTAKVDCRRGLILISVVIIIIDYWHFRSKCVICSVGLM